MSIFFLYLRGMSETGKKFRIITINLKKMWILVILSRFWPVFGLFCSRNVFLMIFLSIFFLVLSEMSETGKKFGKMTIKLKKKMPILAILGHFWPVKAPV